MNCLWIAIIVICPRFTLYILAYFTQYFACLMYADYNFWWQGNSRRSHWKVYTWQCEGQVLEYEFFSINFLNIHEKKKVSRQVLHCERHAVCYTLIYILSTLINNKMVPWTGIVVVDKLEMPTFSLKSGQLFITRKMDVTFSFWHGLLLE